MGLALGVGATALADTFTEGVAAYEAGNYATAYRLWRPLAESGLAEAQYSLGLLNAKGWGVPRDDAEAVRWWRRAAEQGHAAAQFNVGVSYAQGRGVRQDDAEAVRWWHKAAEQGLAAAQFALGLMYDKGLGVPQDDVEAVHWYRRAAEQGNAGAQSMLGFSYALGRGVRQDYVQAYMWLTLAAVQGDDTARKLRDDLANVMTAAQTVEAERLARTWEPSEAMPPAIEAELRAPTPPLAVPRELVRDAQRLLGWLGFDPGPVDGALGARTRGAVEAYQRSRRLPVDGRVTVALVEHLRQEATVEPSPSVPIASDEPAATGSGFFVTANGHLLTNAHVVASCARLRARSAAGEAADASLLASANGDDLALLRASMRPAAVAAFRPGAPLRAGEAVVLFGFPLAGLLASAGNTTAGSIAALAGPGDDARMMQISAPVQPGNSGGPVLDQAGNVVGIVVGKLDALAVASVTMDIPQNVNFAIKASVATNFLEARGVSYTTGPVGDELSVADIADRARDYTVRVECFR